MVDGLMVNGSMVNRSDSERLRGFCNRLTDDRRTFAILESLSRLKIDHVLSNKFEILHPMEILCAAEFSKMWHQCQISSREIPPVPCWVISHSAVHCLCCLRPN